MEEHKALSVKITDPWETLKQFTAARIALGRAGTSIPLTQELEFKLAHAHTRDAVYSSLNPTQLINDLIPLGLPILQLHSRAESRQQYLQRPDLGRLLDASSAQIIKDNAMDYDISITLADGLSANAINDHVVQLLEKLIPLLAGMKYKLAPLCL